MRRMIGGLLVTSLLALGAMAHLAERQEQLVGDLARDWRANPHIAALTTEAKLKNLIAAVERRGAGVNAPVRVHQTMMHASLDSLLAQNALNEEAVLKDAFTKVFGARATLDGLQRLLTTLDPDIRLLSEGDRGTASSIATRLDRFVPLMHALVADSREHVETGQRQILDAQAQNQFLMLSALSISVLAQIALGLMLLWHLPQWFGIRQAIWAQPARDGDDRYAKRRAAMHRKMADAIHPDLGLEVAPEKAPTTPALPMVAKGTAAGMERIREVVADVFDQNKPAPSPEEEWADAIGDMPGSSDTGGTPTVAKTPRRPMAPAPALPRLSAAIQREITDLLPLLDTAMIEAAGALSQRGIVSAIYVDPSVPSSLDLDPNALRIILRQLLGNAFKFTTCGGVVLTVDLAFEGIVRELRITVLDTGIGIAAEDRELIFHDQVQVQPGRASMAVPFDATQRGVGRGLADARDLAQSMGGDIRAYSQPGLGSRFTVTLPLASPGAPVAAADELEGRAYLIVDQSPVRGQVLADQLRALGADVVLADHEMAAMDAVNNNSPANKAGRDFSFDMAIIASGPHPGRAFSLAQRLREGRNAPRRIALAQNLGSALDPLAGEVADHVMTLPMTADDLFSVLRLRVIDPVEGDDSLRLTEARIADLMNQVTGLDAASALTSAASVAVVLETNPADRQHLSSLMQSHGWQVSAFASMEKMMERLDASADLLLIGIGNDEEDQRQALAILQALDERAGHPPVIGLVERDMSPLARDFLTAAGFDALLEKPVSHKAMTRAIMGLASNQMEDATAGAGAATVLNNGSA
ncbi:MAG: hypothetical protein KI792_11145 [Alphaproteobacteria bacterium]|nr:hypothetical protein [Alphaproteobacteria bacterium SS10]